MMAVAALQMLKSKVSMVGGVLVRLVTETEAQMVDYGTGSFTIANLADPRHTDLLFVGADGSQSMGADDGIAWVSGDDGTAGTRLFVGNLTMHSSEVPNAAFGIDWLLW